MARKLLLADDSLTVQRVIELTFQDEDVQVVAVGDGQRAIERIEAERPDIVLADVSMPERDGYDVAAFVKRTPHLSGIPVLLLTGAFEPVDEARARASGCDGVLMKPFEPQLVISRVRDLLAGGRPDPGWDAGRAQARPPEAARPPAVPRSPARLGFGMADAAEPAGAPAAPQDQAPAGELLNDYFDRLDAAFASLQSPAPDQGPAAAPLSAGQPSRPAGERPLAPEVFDSLEPGSVTPPAEGLDGWNPALPDAAGGPSAADAQEPPAPPRLPLEPRSLADAFEALLSVEQGLGSRAAQAPAPAAVSDETVDLVVQRVIERLTSDVVRDTVLDVAERLVREEIARIKSAVT